MDVDVIAEVDVRGTMAIDQYVSVGLQFIRCKVRLGTKKFSSNNLIKGHDNWAFQ